jgi:hypothetical protein
MITDDSIMILNNVYFGQAGCSDFTINKDEARKQRYINRHKKNEYKYLNKSGIDTLSFGLFFCYEIY